MSTIARSADEAWALPVRRSLPQVLAEHVVDAIQTGRLKPGERIVELQLARLLGVSRGPLREALTSLEASGIIEKRGGKGSFVRLVGNEELAHVVTMRAVLEGLAARFVAVSITPDQIAALQARLDEMEKLARQGRTAEWRDHDWSFHEAICVLSGNPHLISAWRAIGDLIRLFLHTHPAFVREADHVIANHERMLSALASGDPDLAERSFRDVLLTSASRRFGQEVPAAFASVTEGFAQEDKR